MCRSAGSLGGPSLGEVHFARDASHRDAAPRARGVARRAWCCKERGGAARARPQAHAASASGRQAHAPRFRTGVLEAHAVERRHVAQARRRVRAPVARALGAGRRIRGLPRRDLWALAPAGAAACRHSRAWRPAGAASVAGSAPRRAARRRRARHRAKRGWAQLALTFAHCRPAARRAPQLRLPVQGGADWRLGRGQVQPAVALHAQRVLPRVQVDDRRGVCDAQHPGTQRRTRATRRGGSRASAPCAAPRGAAGAPAAASAQKALPAPNWPSRPRARQVDGKTIKAQIWDTAGQERCVAQRRTACRERGAGGRAWGAPQGLL